MSDIRQKSVDFLSDSIAAATGGQAAHSAAQQLEEAIYDKVDQSTSNDYRGEIRSIGLTLKKDNPQLAQDVVQGRIAPTDLVNMSQEEMKTEKQAQEDAELRQQNLDASVGVDELDPQYGTMATSQEGRSRMQEEATYGEAGEASYDGGGEGEFKARSQPKVGEAMRGIEFETGGL